MPYEEGRQVHTKKFLRFLLIVLSAFPPDYPVASLVGRQSPQCKDRHHHIGVIYAAAERVSPCPGPQGKHLATYKYSAVFLITHFPKPHFFSEKA